MTIQEQYDSLDVSRAMRQEIARLMASGQTTDEIAVHVNMKPVDIDRIPMKYPDEWHEDFSTAARQVCQLTVLKIMAHAQVLAAATTEPKGLAVLMQAIARFLRLPFHFPTKRPSSKSAAPIESGPESEPEGTAPRTPTPQRERNKPTPKGEAPPGTPGTVPIQETVPEPAPVLLPEFTDAEVLRCVALHKADPENYLASLAHEEPELFAKCVRYRLIPPRPTPAQPVPPSPPRPTLTQRLKSYFKAACVGCMTWVGLHTHPPHH